MINITITGPSRWSMDVSENNDKRHQRKLSNQMLVIISMIAFMYSPIQTRRSQHTWMLQKLRSLGVGSTELYRLVSGISDITLDRYVSQVSQALVRTRNNKILSMSQYFRRNEDSAEEFFTNNEWVSDILYVAPTTVFAPVEKSIKQPDLTVDLDSSKQNSTCISYPTAQPVVMSANKPEEDLILTKEEIPVFAAIKQEKPKGFLGWLGSMFR